MMKSSAIVKLVIISVAFQLFGCLGELSTVAHDNSKKWESVKQDEMLLIVKEKISSQSSIIASSSEVKAGWGFFYDSPKYKYISKSEFHGLEFEWIIKDQIMKVSKILYAFDDHRMEGNGECYLWYDKAEKKLKATGQMDSATGCYPNKLTLVQDADGTFKDKTDDGSWLVGGAIFKPTSSGMMFIKNVGKDMEWVAYTHKNYDAFWARLVSSQAEERKKALDTTLENQAALYRGLKAVESGMQQAQYEQQQADYRQQQMLNEIKRNVDNAERAKTVSNNSNTEITSNKSSLRASVATKGNSTPMKKTYSDSNEKLRSPDNKKAVISYDSETTIARMQPNATSINNQITSKQQRKLLKFLEAVMVCSIPIGKDGNFRCANPLNIINGHLNDISGRRTPEEMVQSFRASCPDPHRLNSSSEMVWGCGFAATGFNNALDRGAGLGISGRQTFYCYPKESSCRRTSPNDD